MNSLPLKICITTGDLDGIGVEVSEKALAQIGSQANVHFLIWRGANSFPPNFQRLQNQFTLKSFTSEENALKFFLSEEMKSSILVEVVSVSSPALWVQQAAQWCFQKKVHGMVTGPISKTEIYRAGLKDMGHTDILKRISNVRNVHMGFLGDKFNVVLTTAHIPLSQVTAKLDAATIGAGLQAANQLRLGLKPEKARLPIALLGLNPHAGEEGLIGTEEQTYFKQVLTVAAEANIPLTGPLVPDAAFLRSNWEKYSVYLALYHDQGLIPFKLVHGQDSGVHVSIGLPFVRTSVDHGTAKDIFGTDKANPASMADAIQACIRLVKSSITK